MQVFHTTLNFKITRELLNPENPEKIPKYPGPIQHFQEDLEISTLNHQKQAAWMTISRHFENNERPTSSSVPTRRIKRRHTPNSLVCKQLLSVFMQYKQK